MTEPPTTFESREGPRGTRFHEIRTFPVIDSTNRYLREAALAGEREGLVAIAEHQSEGRGRQGRKWDSKPGAALLLSVLLKPREVSSPQRMTMALALAVTDALKLEGGLIAKLKWPNDVVVEDGEEKGAYKKIAGVLGELVTDADEIVGIVVGTGVNLNWGGSLPEALSNSATSLDDLTGTSVDNEQFAEVLLHSFHERLARPSWLIQAYRMRCATLGQRVRVALTDSLLTGNATAVDDDGALVVETEDGKICTITAGDVTQLRPIDH